MNIQWLGFVAVILSIIAFIVGYRFGLKQAVLKKWRLTIIAGLLALPGLSFSIYYFHLFPETSGYYHFRSILGTELLIVFIGLAGGLLASLMPRVLLALPFLCVMIFSVVPFLKPLVGPLKDDEMRDLWSDDICMQSISSTCGAASVATILKSLGLNVTEKEVARDAFSYTGGTEAWYLARAVRSRGCVAAFYCDKGLNKGTKLPAVIGTRLHSGLGHFIAVLEMKGDHYVVGDPMEGRAMLTMEQLQKRYEFTGFSMYIGIK